MNRPPSDFTRRHFLAGTSALFAAHLDVPADAGKPAASGPRILALELLCATPLADLKKFYHDSFGLPVEDEKKDRLTIRAGETRLTFVSTSDPAKPFYHFAFNIPENKLLPARTWLKKRATLLPVPESLRDSAFPDDVVHFRHWNAHSLFFLDPAGNVAEFIARHDLKNAAKGEFATKDLLCVSEIALVVDDVTATATALKEVAAVDTYKGASEEFHALGDERGLLLVMKRGRNLAVASKERKAAEVFQADVTVRGTKRRAFAIPKYPYRVNVEA